MRDHRRPLRVAWPAPLRPDRRVAFGAAWLAMVLVAGWGGLQVWRAEVSPPATPPALPAAAVGPTSTSTPNPPPAMAGLDRSEPVEISIESINLQTAVDQIGLAPDGTLEEQPYSTASHAAWYRLGPAPGQVGPAVITGHVDTKSDVAVFFYLSQVQPGDRVVITRADGHTVTFTVDFLRSFPKSNFPTRMVYGSTDYPALRLITCGGPFDRDAGSYRDNIVVFAHLTGHD
jgi:Sortase domain